MKTSTGYSQFGIPDMTPKTQKHGGTSRKDQHSTDNSSALDNGLPRILLYFSEVKMEGQASGRK